MLNGLRSITLEREIITSMSRDNSHTVKCKAAFLDRDGTIIKDMPYCSRLEDVELLPDVPEAIKLLNDNGFDVVIITNQSGVARGYITDDILDSMHAKIQRELSEYGAHIDAVYYCPHHPDEHCRCRKPEPGLLLHACLDFGFDFSRSYMVGDKPMDIEAGKSVGCRTLMVSDKRSLLDAAKCIVANIKTSILVPAYNEESGLPIVLSKLINIVDDSCEIIVIDDGSNDTTVGRATEYPNVITVGLPVNKGKGSALVHGIQEARGYNIIWIDADDSYTPELIPQMIHAMDTEYDAVVCSRMFGRENIPKFNRVGNWIFRTMIKKIYGFTPFDPMTGLYGAKKEHLLKMDLSAKRFAIEPEISIKGARMGLNMLDIPSEYKVRVGQTKLNGIKVGFEDLFMILRLLFWGLK